uniref:EF-hand domain-containing protein n=1 Tax=Haptolina ericina TaxID=156174 RepID=A0A7S3F511_9EUKA
MANPTRRIMMRRTFKLLDQRGDGELVLQELRSKWNGAADKRVSSGELTETLAFEELVREMQANNNGTPRSAASINFEEFESFCIAKYGHLENDDAFCSAMSRQWGEIPYVSSKVIAQLEKRIQESLLKKGGSERDVLSKAFRSLLVPDRT